MCVYKSCKDVLGQVKPVTLAVLINRHNGRVLFLLRDDETLLLLSNPNCFGSTTCRNTEYNFVSRAFFLINVGL